MAFLSHLTSWRDEWQLELQAGRPGDETITVYLRSVNQFLAWLSERHPDVTEPAQLVRTHPRDWMIHLTETGKSEATRRIRGIALRKWLAYIVSQSDSGLLANPTDALELPKPKAPPVPIVPDEDLAMLLRSMAGASYVDRRDTAIIRLLLDAGLRRAELVGINVADLDLQYQQVLVHGKGSKDRFAPFGGKTTLALRKYLRARATHPGASQAALFLALRADGRSNWRLRGSGVRAMLGRRCAAAGLGHVHPHQFRHTWAADLKGQGLSDDQLERLAGWSTPEMSRRYGNVVADAQARDSARRLARGDRV